MWYLPVPIIFHNWSFVYVSLLLHVAYIPLHISLEHSNTIWQSVQMVSSSLSN
jgi:hypothetical protein